MELEDVTNDALRLTQMFVKDLQTIMGVNGELLPDISLREKQALSGLLAKLMRAATGMVKEARALAKDAKEAAKKLSYEEKRDMILEFIRMMPVEHQVALRNELGWGVSA